MTHSLFRPAAGFLILGFLTCMRPVNAEDIQAAQLLPASTVGYVEIPDPASVLSAILDHPLNAHVQQMEVYKKATFSEGYRSFLTGRKFFELQIGSEWRPAIENLTSGGIVAAFDAATNGFVLLIRGKDEATMENFRVKILELTRLNQREKPTPEDYRGIPVYALETGGAVVVKDTLVVTNNKELGKSVLDRLLDAGATDVDAEVPETLSADSQFQSAKAGRNPDSQIWAFANLQAIRDAGGAEKFFAGKAENPLAELLLGGIQSTLQSSPYLTAEATYSLQGIQLQWSSPFQADWVPEERLYFFGPDLNGSAPVLPEISETLVTFGMYRDVSQMWLRAGDLFDEQMNDKLAEADSGLTTIFAGRDFGEEILGSLSPQLGLIVARQSFDNVKPVPTIKLPSFALVATLRDPETMRGELRRTFQSAVGFLNIVGAQNGQPQLDMDMQKLDDVDLVTARYLPEKKDKDSTTAPIIFNFSPSVAFAGDRFIFASTAALATQLAQSPVPAPEHQSSNTHFQLHAPVLRDVLNDNRDQLISQNMLKEGQSREEAEVAIDLLLELVHCFRGASLSLQKGDDRLTLKMELNVNETPGHEDNSGRQ